MDEPVVVVFTREEAELVQVLLDEPFLYAEDDDLKRTARGARAATTAGLNAVQR